MRRSFPVRAALVVSCACALALGACSDRDAKSPPVAVAERLPASNAVSSAPITEIHSVADLVAGAPAARIDLRGPDARGDADEATRGALTEALVREVQATAAKAGWPDHGSATVKVQGDTLVVRASRAYQDALSTYLTGLRGSATPR